MELFEKLSEATRPLKMVEPVDFMQLSAQEVKQSIAKLQREWILKEALTHLETNENVFIELMALAEIAQDNEYNTVCGILLDVINARYSEQYQNYLTK